ncbi:luciferase domain-containing protein [Ruegeria arenilitoris]|uniref:luciferase domain-containing protein n=1 Tax=Ruegeria arenilitoris TaxID=1173585 RepID=UPI00147BE53A|nr:luciferase family protein [Ruegeria arenilitoris]
MNVRYVLLGNITAAIFFVAVASVAAQTTDLPERRTPRPETTDGVPHVQIGVSPAPELIEDLLSRVENIPDVEIRETVVSLPGAKGFWLADELPLKHPEVIVGGREFAHVHPDGSLHASLDPKIARQAIKAGWAIAHPWSKKRPGWEGFVMIYTPSSQQELDVVFQLVLASYNYVTGRSLSAG